MSGVEKTNNPITKDAAARIQSNEAKNGKDTGFDSRAQAAADKNANEAAKQGNGQGEQKK
ncbi:hypothetical protein FPRO06_09240 [Fusarium proliferatum]|uniref:SMP domain-containing protein n=2 Tax=Gibberella intermedia TaxID=948311 RepID=A0A1L7VLY1_FUSPR|nr:uncharacterized protein FPRO_11023 [Fusarium proliferatum ET1]KAG4282567.1 hypothetical protein FPRO06_09240 [Fusarium proliferatum]RBA22699.1 hypothetical protein FPRO05_01046 [Fusarium proliferatum]CVK98107.1 uncharacterized protein FPRN_10622 [Fusarium proliferatum]CZR41434.1 uncharacterized protein FPRO_11023 [Fusarium proliferatum ET1]